MLFFKLLFVSAIYFKKKTNYFFSFFVLRGKSYPSHILICYLDILKRVIQCWSTLVKNKFTSFV